MTLLRTTVREQAKALLIAANTFAQRRVYTSRATPLDRREGSALLISTPEEEGQSKGNAGEPKFTTHLVLVIGAIVESADPELAEGNCDLLCEQALNALLCNPAFLAPFEEVVKLKTSSELRNMGDSGFSAVSAIEITLRYLDVYSPALGPALQKVNVKTDALQPADPSGTYPDPGYPVTPAPRTQGPDGRVELEADITFNTP